MGVTVVFHMGCVMFAAFTCHLEETPDIFGAPGALAPAHLSCWSRVQLLGGIAEPRANPQHREVLGSGWRSVYHKLSPERLPSMVKECKIH